MANNLIPTVDVKVGVKGRFVLNPPFAELMKPNTLYTLSALRKFDEIESFGENIFTTYYNPFKLTEADLQRDRASGAMIASLMTLDARPIYVPTSYIKSYPDLNYRPYNQYIAVLSFGPLPDDTLFEPTLQALKNTTSEFLGVEPEVNLAFMPLSDVITPEQHANLEATRQAAISNRSTDYARLAEVTAQRDQLQQQVIMYQKIIKDNGLLG
jgi:hypothetical protein